MTSFRSISGTRHIVLGTCSRLRFIFSACFSGRYGVSIEFSWSGRRRYGRLAVIRGGPQLRIGAGSFFMLSLSRYRRNVSLPLDRLLLRSCARVDPAIASVVTYAVHRGVVDYRGVVNVVNVRHIDVVNGAVIEKVPVIPSSAFIAVAEVTEAVVNSAVEANVRTPKAHVKNKCRATPSPPARRPEESRLRGQHPCTWHPVVAVRAVSPIARRPEIAFGGARGLLVDGKCGWAETDRYADLRGRCCRYHHQHHNGDKQHREQP